MGINIIKLFISQDHSGRERSAAEQELRRAIKIIPRFIGLIVNLLRDPRVSTADKAILGATVAYILNPADIVPDWIPFLGLVDDVYLVVLALLRLMLRTDESVLKENWHGPGDLIPILKKTGELAVGFLPARVRRALLARVE